MFKERIAFIRQNRLSKRSKDFGIAEEARYSAADSNADCDTSISKFRIVQLYSSAIRKFGGKNSNDIVSSIDISSLSLGIEDSGSKSLADKKAYKYIIVCVLCSVLLFAALYFTGDFEDKSIERIKRGDDKEKYSLDVEFSYGGETLSLSDDVTVLPKDYEDEDEIVRQPESFLEAFSRKLIKEINGSTDGEYVSLPTEKDGVLINWKLPGDEIPTWIFGICILLCFFIYFTRYDSLKKKEKLLKAEFVAELPNMILQYILMLNAGLISEFAFEELINQNLQSKNYLYKVFSSLLQKARSTNSSFVSEMYSFASYFGNKEFLRFSTMCIEHSHSGSELASKLEQERNSSWNSMLNAAKAKAKEAETKLCFPLMLLLVALVIICITPAMLEM